MFYYYLQFTEPGNEGLGLGCTGTEVPWQTMSVPIPLIGKAAKLRQLCQPIRVKTYSSVREMTGQDQPQLPDAKNHHKRTRKRTYIIANKNKRLLIKENVFFQKKSSATGIICYFY